MKDINTDRSMTDAEFADALHAYTGMMSKAEKLVERHNIYDFATAQHARRVARALTEMISEANVDLSKWGIPLSLAEVVAFLHDAIEDASDLAVAEDLKVAIRHEFGEDAVALVCALTRHHTETYFDYVRRCKQNPIARLIKIADIRDNMRREDWPGMGYDGVTRNIYPCPPKMRKRYAKALAMLMTEVAK